MTYIFPKICEKTMRKQKICFIRLEVKWGFTRAKSILLGSIRKELGPRI